MWGYRPWLLGPVLLLRRRAVLVALLVASAVGAVPVAAAPLFLSAAHSATLHRQMARSCQWYVGTYTSGRLPMRFEGPRVTEGGTLPAHPFGEELWRRRRVGTDLGQVRVSEVVAQLPAEQGGYPVVLIRADALPAYGRPDRTVP